MQKNWLQYGLVRCLGMMHGMAFALLPSVSNILIDPSYYHFSNFFYGLLYLPWTFGFLAAWIYAGDSGAAKGWRPILGIGMGLMALAMLFLALSNVAPDKSPINYCLMMAIAGILGAGLGFNWPALKALAGKEGFAEASLSLSLGLGAALSPLLFNLFFAEGLWWLAPICMFTGWVLLFNFAIFLPILNFPQPSEPSKEREGILDLSWTFWMFFAVVALFAFCKSALGAWIPIYMGSIKKLTFEESNQALAAFWLMSALGQALIALAIQKISFRWFFVILPLAIFWVLGIIPEVLGASDLIIASAIAGAACSGFLPLCVLFAESTQAKGIAAISKGLMIAYCFGYLFGSYGLGELQHMQKIPLEAIFFFASLPAAFMTILAWLILYFFPRQPSKKRNGA